MISVYKRELKTYFSSMTAPICIAALIALVGLYFYGNNVQDGKTVFSYSLISAWFILIVLVPIITMRSFADEKRLKTDQILLTSPLSISDIVFGKYFAMCSVFLAPMILFAFMPLVIKTFGYSSFLTDYTTMFAYFIMICMFVAIGMYISSLFENVVITSVCTFGILLIIYLWSSILSIIPTDSLTTMIIGLVVLSLVAIAFYSSTKNWVVALVIETVGVIAMCTIKLLKPALLEGFIQKYLAGVGVFDTVINFAYYQVFDLAGIIRMLVFISVFLFLTGQSIQKRRWS